MMIGTYPVLVLGPTNRGRSYGVIGRSEQLRIGDAQITNLSMINHDMVDYLRSGDSLYCLFRVPGTEAWHFLSVSSGLAPIEGNAVVVTSGLLLPTEDLDRFGNRLPLIARSALDGLAATPDSRMKPREIDWAAAGAAPTGTPPALQAFGGLLGDRRVRLRDRSNREDLRRSAPYGLQCLGEIMAQLPPGRAADLTWSTYPAKLANWSVSLVEGGDESALAGDDRPILIDVARASTGRIEVRETNAPRTLIDTEAAWSALVHALGSLGDTTVEHGKTLDHFREKLPPGDDPAACIAARCEALLRHMSAAFGSAARLEWLVLLARAAAGLGGAGPTVDLEKVVRRIVARAVVEGDAQPSDPSARAQILDRFLGGGKEALFARLNPGPGELLALARAADDPLLYWDSVSDAERAELAISLRGGWEGLATASAVACLGAVAVLAGVTAATREVDLRGEYYARLIEVLRVADRRMRQEGLAWTALLAELRRRIAGCLPSLADLAYDMALPLERREALREAADRVTTLLPESEPEVRLYHDRLWQSAIRQITGQSRHTETPDRMALFDGMTSFYRVKLPHLARNHVRASGEIVR
ncbi:MAG TPA: hypothetical protein VFQ67_01890 [Allosphingosinicella sp.]|jgi:hypothetical protein|nr:hypothetical protein [Allosphingosinicella sp.]